MFLYAFASVCMVSLLGYSHVAWGVLAGVSAGLLYYGLSGGAVSATAMVAAVATMATATLTKLIERSWEGGKARAEEIKARAEEIKAKAEEVKARAEEVKARAEEVKARAEEIKARAEEVKAKAEEVKARAAVFEARSRFLIALLGYLPEEDRREIAKSAVRGLLETLE